MDRDAPMLSPKEAARLLGVHHRTVLRWCARGALPHVRVERTIRIRRADLDALVTRPRRRRT